LKDNAEIATGDPIACVNCNAIFNINSVVENVKAEGGVIGQQNDDEEK